MNIETNFIKGFTDDCVVVLCYENTIYFSRSNYQTEKHLASEGIPSFLVGIWKIKKLKPYFLTRKKNMDYAEWKDENNIKSNGWGGLTYNGKLYTAHEISKMYETYKYSTK